MSRGYNRPYIVGTLPPPPSYTLPPASSYHPAKVPGWGPQPSPAYPPRWTNHVDAQQNIYAVGSKKNTVFIKSYIHIFAVNNTLLNLMNLREVLLGILSSVSVKNRDSNSCNFTYTNIFN